MSVGYGAGTGILWLLMALLWIALAALIVFLVMRLNTGSGSADPRSGDAPVTPESPEQILDRMFAIGEIDEQTYRARRTALAEMQRPS